MVGAEGEEMKELVCVVAASGVIIWFVLCIIRASDENPRRDDQLMARSTPAAAPAPAAEPVAPAPSFADSWADSWRVAAENVANAEYQRNEAVKARNAELVANMRKSAEFRWWGCPATNTGVFARFWDYDRQLDPGRRIAIIILQTRGLSQVVVHLKDLRQLDRDYFSELAFLGEFEIAAKEALEKDRIEKAGRPKPFSPVASPIR
jgi:hypothetical protein